MQRLTQLENTLIREDVPSFRTGDTVKVHTRIALDSGKERIQIFEGVVLRRRGEGLGETFTVRKISNGVGVERIFPINAPVVSKVELVKSAHVRQSRLYFLRSISGKAARLKERRRHVRK